MVNNLLQRKQYVFSTKLIFKQNLDTVFRGVFLKIDTRSRRLDEQNADEMTDESVKRICYKGQVVQLQPSRQNTVTLTHLQTG